MDIRCMESYKKLGLNIAYYRKANGLSQEKLAELVGISRTHMSRIEWFFSLRRFSSIRARFATSESLKNTRAFRLMFLLSWLGIFES